MLNNKRSFLFYYFIIILASLVPIVLFGYFTYSSEKNAHEASVIQKLQSINLNKKEAIENHFKEIEFEVNELKNTVSFLQQQAVVNIQNIQELQKSSIIAYYQSLENIITLLSKKDIFQYSFSFLNRGKTVAPEYLNELYKFKTELGIQDIYMFNKQGKIVYASDDHNTTNNFIQTLTPRLQNEWQQIQKLNYQDGNHTYFVDFSYDKKLRRYREFILSPFRDVQGFIAFEINQEPIQKILKNVYSLGKTAETYLIYQENNHTYLASNRSVKKGSIGDEKSNIFIEKGFYKSGVEVKYGSTGSIELVGYVPVVYKNLHHSMQTTVRFIDIISPKIHNQDYFEQFIKDYHYHNLLLVSSKEKIIYSIKHHQEQGENLFNTNLTHTLLAQSVQNVLHTKKFEISDFGFYNECQEKIAHFAVSPIITTDKDVDILVVLQLERDSLSKVINNARTLYYNTLDTYVIGKDGYLRSQTQLEPKKYNVYSSFENNIDYNKQELQEFFTTGKNIFYSKDYRGKETLKIYRKITTPNFEWAVVTKIDISELNGMTQAIKKEVIVFIVIFSILAIIIMLFLVSIKNKQDKKLIHSATHDSLTYLPNRRYILEVLDHIIAATQRKNTHGAILFMDLDKFKYINDSYGHEAGDFVLQQVAHRLQQLLRQEDLLARLGGDEFVVVIQEYDSRHNLDDLCQRIIHLLSQPIVEGKNMYQIGVSIGVAIFPDDSHSVNELLQYADTAMYKTKESGRNGYSYYSKEMTQKSLNTLRVEKDLKKAIENDELVLYYQPQIDIQNKKLVGVEALIRWNHPTDGFLPPNEFIPIAEDSHLIIDLGRWVLERACKDFKSWKTAGHTIDYVAVNMSAKQLECQECSQTIRQLLHDTAFDPQWLELEITENTLIENFERVMKNIEIFKEMGINFSIDDFGTGYSSLSYLKSLQISTLKIDREFIKDILEDKDDYSIVKAIISMGHALNYKIIAEGAERKEEVQLLQTMGCDVVQGYYFSKPLSELELLEFMQKCETGGGNPLDLF